MNIFLQMKGSKEKVLYLLRNYPSLRDSDTKLLATYWHNELNRNSKNISGFEVLEKMANGELTKSESIRRVRQKIQEENPELRGELWSKRQILKEEIQQNIFKL